jgi:adenosylcobyric acid synthase
VARPLGERSAATERALGTYLHGPFENGSVRAAFVDGVFEFAGRSRPPVADASVSPYEAAANLVDEHLPVEELLGDADGPDAGRTDR